MRKSGKHLAVAYLVLLSVYLLSPWASFAGGCIATYKIRDASQGDKHYVAIFLMAPFYRFRCLASSAGDFVDAEHDVVIAVGTLVIAAFTYTLWNATSRLSTAASEQGVDMKESLRIAQVAAKAAQESSRVALSTQRPWISLFLELDGGITFSSCHATAKLAITLLNSGDFAATDVMFTEGFWTGEAINQQAIIENGCKEMMTTLAPYQEKQMGIAVFPKEMEKQEDCWINLQKWDVKAALEKSRDGRIPLYVAAAIKYRHALGFGTTTVVYAVSGIEADGVERNILVVDGVIAARLKLRKLGYGTRAT